MVKAGIDRICEPSVRALLNGKRIGLVGGASGLNRSYLGTIEAMTEQYRVAALYAPEHGSRGVLGPGEAAQDGVDRVSGIASFSLFRDMVFSEDENEKSSVYAPSELPIDILVFDKLHDIISCSWHKIPPKLYNVKNIYSPIILEMYLYYKKDLKK